jgi:hypothetical protein
MDWSNDLFEALETAAIEIEQFFTDVAKGLDEALDACLEVSEAAIDQLSDGFLSEFEHQVSGWVDPILEAYLGFEVAVGDATQPIAHTVDPMMNDHPACVGCRHYHGQMYGENMLVCGMHPYGWDSEKCPDWQSTWEA